MGVVLTGSRRSSDASVTDSIGALSHSSAAIPSSPRFARRDSLAVEVHPRPASQSEVRVPHTPTKARRPTATSM